MPLRVLHGVARDTIKEWRQATEELRKQKHDSACHTLSSKILVNFLLEIERKEKELENQLAENRRKGLTVVDGGKRHVENSEQPVSDCVNISNTIFIDVNNVKPFDEF